MIYGGISLDNNITVAENLLAEFSNVLCWPKAVGIHFEWEAFTGIYLYDPILPYSKEDFIFHDPENEVVVIIDGFIYNRNDIINQLSLSDDTIDTPQLICKAFLSWGESFVQQLNGDFAICIYHKKNNQAFFYRDQLGIRPLATCRIGPVIYFSTEIVGFCKALFQHEKIERQYLLNMFMGEGFKYSLLPNKEVVKVAPGHFVFADAIRQVISKYWNPAEIKKDTRLDFSRIISELEILLLDAVKIRSDNRFFASAHISGGLDSGIVAALARHEYKEQNEFYGFSWTPDFSTEKEIIGLDERFLVNSICQQHHIKPVHSNFTVDDYFAFMSNWRYSSELIFEKKIIEAACANKVNLIFSGWGGDEFISLGNRGIDADLFKEMNWVSLIKKYPLRQPKKLFSALLFNVCFPSAQRSYLKYKTDPYVYKYLRNGLTNNIIPRNERFSLNSRRRVHLQLIAMYHLALRCEDWYVHGQRHGVEYRYPLLDKRIVEYMLKIPSKLLVQGGNDRVILRNICKGILPDEVIKNKSKDDPVKSHFLSKVAAASIDILVNEINDFKQNPDLDFIDFKLLEKTIQLNKKEKNKETSEEISLILYYIKYAHEFTKGYYQ